MTPPVQAADGNFYGTTSRGGSDFIPDSASYGTIYRMDSNGVLTTLFTFSQTNGAGVGGISGLVVGNDGAFYGVTQGGGPDFTNANGGDGTIFKITTNGDFTLLATFNGTNGLVPVKIIQASDGNFYGATRQGGINDSSGLGTLFQMTPDGQINTLVRFSGTNGALPGEIMQASDGYLYGTTSEGGAFGYGTVFKLTTNGDFTLLASFDGTNGSSPFYQLTESCNGIFYGTTVFGGKFPIGGIGGVIANNLGTVFRVTTNGDLTTVLSFGADSLLPGIPQSPLTKASDGNYYGVAQDPNSGSIFCVRPVQPPVLQPLAQNNQLNLSWNAWAGYSYAVMYETNLTGSNWNLLSTVTPQANGITSFSDPIGPDAQRFYSVILQLP